MNLLNAVRKAKAAGMKAGEQVQKWANKEYTLQDAIELAGMQLEDFFSEEEQAYDNQIDRIKNLHFTNNSSRHQINIVVYYVLYV